MSSYWKHVNSVLKESDLILEVLDARMIEETRNREIEAKIIRYNKPVLYVINKCDLVGLEELQKIKKSLNPSVFISSTDKLGTTILKKKIMEMSRGERVVVGVVGYPNVGKSSLINALSGRKAAKTSSTSGFTQGLQKIKVDNKILLLDTPGVFPLRENNDYKYGKTGAIDYAKIRDPELIALKIIQEHKAQIVKHYKLSAEDDEEQLLEKLAFKFGKLQAAGEPNLEGAARKLLKDWQSGEIK